MTEKPNLDERDGLSPLNTDLARSLVGAVPSARTGSVTVGTEPHFEEFTLFASRSTGALILYRTHDFCESWQGDVTDVVPAFEQAVAWAEDRREEAVVQTDPLHE
jgi:hypothetical protein